MLSLPGKQELFCTCLQPNDGDSSRAETCHECQTEQMYLRVPMCSVSLTLSANVPICAAVAIIDGIATCQSGMVL